VVNAAVLRSDALVRGDRVEVAVAVIGTVLLFVRKQSRRGEGGNDMYDDFGVYVNSRFLAVYEMNAFCGSLGQRRDRTGESSGEDCRGGCKLDDKHDVGYGKESRMISRILGWEDLERSKVFELMSV